MRIEYLVVIYPPAPQPDLDTQETVSARKAAEPDRYIDWLNSYGQQGWELCFPPEGEKHTFKRGIY